MCPPFPYATPLSAPFCFHYSFSLCFSICFNFISVFATHIVPLPLSCSHYFHSTAWSYTCKPLLSLYHSGSPAPFFLFFPGFVAPLIYSFDQYSPLYLLPCFPSQFFFNIVTFHSPLICPCYFPLLFHFCPILLDLLSPVPPLYPFLASVLLAHCPMPPHWCWLCNVCTTSIYPLPSTSCCLSSFISSPIFFLS